MVKGTKVIEAAPVDLSRVEIPAPSIGTQRKVVDILDRFDTLTKSLTDGTPAEIEARRAQYGYYRDRLLDFPRKAIGTEWSDGTRAAAKGLSTFVTVANSSRAIWAARRKIADLNREAPSTFPQTLCIIIKGRARASAFAETQLEARISLFRAALASYVSRFPLQRLPLIRERLLRLGAHRRLLKCFRRLAGASLGVLRGLARLGRIVAEERELRLFVDNESQDLLIGRFCAEDDAGGAVSAVLDVLRQPDPELAVVIYGQGGRHADLHGWLLLYVDNHAEKGQPRR